MFRSSNSYRDTRAIKRWWQSMQRSRFGLRGGTAAAIRLCFQTTDGDHVLAAD